MAIKWERLLIDGFKELYLNISYFSFDQKTWVGNTLMRRIELKPWIDFCVVLVRNFDKVFESNFSGRHLGSHLGENGCWYFDSKRSTKRNSGSQNFRWNAATSVLWVHTQTLRCHVFVDFEVIVDVQFRTNVCYRIGNILVGLSFELKMHF